MDMREMGRKRRATARPLVGPGVAPAGTPDGALLEEVTATQVQTPDLDLLRLSYVCRADVLLRGLPERSRVLSTIHRFFDASPDRASAEAFPLSALIAGIGTRMDPRDGA